MPFSFINPDRFDGYHLRNDFLWGAYLILMTHVVWYGGSHELYQVLLGAGFYVYKATFLTGLLASLLVMVRLVDWQSDRSGWRHYQS